MYNLTIRFLITCSGARTAELLGLAATRVGNQQRAIISDQDITQLLLRGLIDKLLTIGNDGLCYSLTDGVNLGRMTTSPHTNSDVEVSKFVFPEDQDWFKDLQAKYFGLDEFQGNPIHSDHTLPLLAMSNSGGSFFSSISLYGGHLEEWMERNRIDALPCLSLNLKSPALDQKDLEINSGPGSEICI